MKKKDFYKIIEVSKHDTGNGTLMMYQKGNNDSSEIPFEIKKVLVIKGMKGEDSRGGHTHHKTNQVLICISGSCSVDLDNGSEKTTIKLSKENKGLLLYPYVWHVMKDFSENTILLVLADREYDEEEYIRNYEDFIKCVK